MPAQREPDADGADPAREPELRTSDPEAPHLPLIEAAGDAIAEAALEGKPSWRGWVHAATTPLALIAGIALVMLADGATATLSTAVYAATSVLMFGVSAVYHRFHWQERTRVLLKRLDHANIFLLIAGTYTPLAILALPPGKGYLLLVLVWAGAAIGIGFRVFWITAPRWAYVPLYVLLGWAAILYIVDLFKANPAMVVLVVAGGLAYTAGAVIYGMKRPNPVPGVFGFHEIFHTLTVIAFLCHWTGILLVALDPPFGG